MTQSVSLNLPESPSQFMPWALSLALAAVLFLYKGREKDRIAANKLRDEELKAQIATLKEEKAAIKAEYETRLAAAQKTNETLGAKLDAIRDKAKEDAEKVASLLLHARREPERAEAWEAEMPSQVQYLTRIAPTEESRTRYRYIRDKGGR